jgi:hypothetical protein
MFPPKRRLNMDGSEDGKTESIIKLNKLYNKCERPIWHVPFGWTTRPSGQMHRASGSAFSFGCAQVQFDRMGHSRWGHANRRIAPWPGLDLARINGGWPRAEGELFGSRKMLEPEEPGPRKPAAPPEEK